MKKIIKKVFIIIFTSLMLVSSVSAANFKISGSGNPSPSGASGKNRNYPATDHTTLSTGVGLKLSLVKMSDNGPHYVSYYYYLINNKNFTTSSTLINGPYFTSSCGGGAAGCNRGGAKAVYGNINNGNYTIHSVPSPSITTYTEFDILDHTAAKKNGFDYGFNVSAEKVKKAIMPGGVPNDLFYKMITPLFRKDSSYRDGSAAAFPSGLNYDDNNTVTSIKDLLTNPNNSTKAAALNDYRIIIEPIYNFQNLKYRGKGDIFATLKTIAKVQTGEELNSGLAAGLGGLTGDPSSIFKNFFTCEEDTGIRNDCGSPSWEKMADVKSGLGYMIISITDEIKGCNPADPNGNVCCYTKNEDGSYKYDKDLDGKTGENRYKCVLKGTDTPSPNAKPYCPGDGSAEFKECGGCDPTKECCYDITGTYQKDFSGTGKKGTYKCNNTPNADKSCPSVGMAVNALTSCYQEEDKCPEGTGVNGTTKPFTHNYYFVTKLYNTSWWSQLIYKRKQEVIQKAYDNYCVKRNRDSTFYSKTGIHCNQYENYNANSSSTTSYNKSFEPYKLFDNIAKERGLSVTNYEVISAKNIPLSIDNLPDFYAKYIRLRKDEAPNNYYYTDGEGNYYIASSNSESESNDSLTLDYSNYWANSNYIRNSVTLDSNNNSYSLSENSKTTSSYVTFNFNRQYNYDRLQYYNSNYKNSYYVYHPVQYKISYCLSTEEALPKCDDTVNPARCDNDSMEGTHAVFHENDDLNTCTLNTKVSSGFTAVYPDNTITGEGTMNYCSVACKEDIDMYLPKMKNAAAGNYFTLIYSFGGQSSLVPKITAKRTCVTSNIDYNKFNDDLNKAEDELVTLYNTWQDWIEINGNKNSSSYNGGLSTLEDYYDSSFHDCGCSHRSCSGEGEERTCHTVCDGDYTTYYWRINGSTGTNNNNSNILGGASYNGDSGSYNRGCRTSTNTSKSTYDNNVTQQMKAAEQAYYKALQAYRDRINAYNRCFSWTNVTKNVSVASGTYKVSVSNSDRNRITNTYAYKFKPTVSFDYGNNGKEWDASYFNTNKEKSSPTEYEYKYDKDVVTIPLKTTNTYWSKGIGSTDYQNGGSAPVEGIKDIGLNYEPRNLVNCSGTTCTKTGNVIGSNFYTSSFIKRTEEISYEYHLPRLATTIPNGKLNKIGNYNTSSTTSANSLVLDKEAVPININTVDGYYEYNLKVSNLVESSDIRAKNKIKDKKYKDTFVDRFKSSKVLNSGDTYVCDYSVINDIYKPTGTAFNSKDNSGQPNFFYRVIDMDNVNPNSRSLGYNWNTAGAQTVKERMKDINSDYQKLVGNEEVNGKTSEKFEFVLTPQMMRAIREYNGEQNDENKGGYSDWDLTCTNGSGIYHCESLFLTCLTSGGKSNSQKCSGIFEDNVLESNSKVSGYNFENLQENRSKLIKKLQELGQR